MDCTICMNVFLHKKNIVELNCGHKLCSFCFDKLIRNLCPYCRRIIDNKIDHSYNIVNEFNYQDHHYNEINNNYNETDNYLDHEYYNYHESENVLPISELYYIEDLFYTNNSYDIVHLHKKLKNNRNNKGFTSNKNRESYEREKKKWKKMKIY